MVRKHIYLELFDDSFIEKIRSEIGTSINAVSIHESKESLAEELLQDK